MNLEYMNIILTDGEPHFLNYRVKVFYKTAKEIIEEFSEKEWFINANYQMRYDPHIGMDDNSIDLSWYWGMCDELVKYVENNKS